MKILTPILLLWTMSLLFFSCKQISSGQDQRTYEETLAEYLVVSGQDFDDVPFLQENRDKDGIFADILKGEGLFAAMMDSIIQNMTNNIEGKYKAAFTQAELEELIDFYKSPLGEKMVAFNKKSILENLDVFPMEFLKKKLGDLYVPE